MVGYQQPTMPKQNDTETYLLVACCLLSSAYCCLSVAYLPKYIYIYIFIYVYIVGIVNHACPVVGI